MYYNQAGALPTAAAEINPLQNPRCSTGGFVGVSALAKINLFLAIAGKRNDGYHDIVSVMQSLELCDRLTFSHVGDDVSCVPQVDFIVADCTGQMQGVQKQLHSICDNAAGVNHKKVHLPTGDDNLVVKAANLFMREYNITTRVKITLDKHIPIGAGLGGGSSNAAATLHGLNRLFSLNISQEELVALGAQLGADVPFCVMGGTALATGIGEKLTPLAPHPLCYILLAYPPIHVSTKEIFNMLQQPRLDSCTLAKLDSFFTAYSSKDASQIAQHLENAFIPITSSVYPQITTLINDMKTHGALGASMTGTGATVFAYFENEHTAKRACDILQQRHSNVRFIQTATITS